MTPSSFLSIVVLLHPILGYWLLRFKGYRNWWNLLLLISFTPLFWLIAGCMTSRNKIENTSWASILSILFAIVSLGFIMKFQN